MMIKALNRVNSWAQGYSLQLYCDHFNDQHPSGDGHASAQYYGESFRECSTQARKAGWILHHNTRTSTCGLCAAFMIKNNRRGHG